MGDPQPRTTGRVWKVEVKPCFRCVLAERNCQRLVQFGFCELLGRPVSHRHAVELEAGRDALAGEVQRADRAIAVLTVTEPADTNPSCR
jgi:hypothetical protein